MPAHSFLLRDHRNYRAVTALSSQMDRLGGLAVRFPPGELNRLLPLNPLSLNMLYERWVQLAVFDWLAERFGTPPRGFAGDGVWTWRSGMLTTTLRLDHAYPRSGSAGVIVPVGKNRPDVAIERAGPDGVEVLVLDATYSHNPKVVEEKFQYAMKLRDAGRAHDLTGDPPLVTRWCAAVTPEKRSPSILELGAGLSRARLNLPPSPESERLLENYLSATFGAGVL